MLFLWLSRYINAVEQNNEEHAESADKHYDVLQQVATRTGTTVVGELFPGALADEDGPAASYLDLRRHNATTIATALAKKLLTDRSIVVTHACIMRMSKRVKQTTT